ncbi:hypothetical protein JG687_00017902 [Phytophthora cactorum]|uniref:Uncharacterized protein n=1 Tax=Phytophthora cactorum TaxID=29920 RepID=A0A8T1TQX5_9STRA|nr:hypothetical protein JG687_00017902 [Phytophthora cactorum]
MGGLCGDVLVDTNDDGGEKRTDDDGSALGLSGARPTLLGPAKLLLHTRRACRCILSHYQQLTLSHLSSRSSLGTYRETAFVYRTIH